jgi:hypothetical protein
MSRLDSAIRRLTAQRACLDAAIGMIAGRDGPVLELGLGNGRSYDHLRAALPGRAIFVFDRRAEAHPDCMPDDDHLILGDFHDTLPVAAVLAHCDIGSGRPEADAQLAAFVAGALSGLLAPGAVVAADQALDTPALAALDLPAGVDRGRYFMYRAGTP